MKFTKRLSAAILAVVMTVSSVQVSGKVSYAAEIADSSIGNGQEAYELAAEADSGGGSETAWEDETEMTEAEIDGAYQFGGAPEPKAESKSSKSRISTFSVSTYDDSVEEYLHQQMLKRTTSLVDVQKYSILNSKDVIEQLISSVLNEYPDLYFVKKTYSYAIDGTGRYITAFAFNYSKDYDDEAFEESVKKALSCVDDEMSDLQKAAALHDYLAVNVEYDYENLLMQSVPDSSHTAYGALVNHISVCEGYALAYKYLLNQVGIECYMVTSKSMNHAWNMVKLDGKYYHVDVTWDDPTWDMVGRAMHTYFLSSDSNLAKHRDWQVTDGGKAVDYTATDTTYEYAFWKKSTAPLVMEGNYCYYVSDDGSLRKAGFANIRDAGTEIISIGKWPTWDGSGTWSGAYSGLYMIDGRLFYNDPYSIYSIEKDGTDKRKEFTAMMADGYIYGSAYLQDKVCYALHKDPNLSAREEVLTAELAGSGDPEEPEPDDAPIPPFTTSEGWNIENPHLNFMVEYGFDDEIELSTGIEGTWGQYYNRDRDPVVLMFFSSKASDNTAAQTFMNVYEGSAAQLRKARLYAIDISGASLEDLNTWRKNNGNYWGNLHFGRGDKSMLAKYCEVVAEVTGVDLRYQYGNTTYPFIFYIDENDKIQYAWNFKEKKLDEMYDDLRKYCNYKMCNITWDLNGGTVNTNYDSTNNVYSTAWKWCHTKEKDTILPKPNYREGYRFEGWYLDSRFTKKLTKIPQGTVADFALYAKWSVMKGPFGIDNPEQEYTTLDDTTISSTADGRPKLLLFMRNDGFSDCSHIKKISDAMKDDPEHALHGVDIHVIDTTKTSKDDLVKYTRNWSVWSDEITVSYDTGDGNQECLEAYAKEARIDLDTMPKSNYPLIVFYIDAQNRLQYVNIMKYSSLDNIVDNIMFDLRAFCNYPTAGAKFYNIKYVLNGGTNNVENPEIYHSEMEENIVLKDPLDWYNYTFDGWYTDATFYDRVTEIKIDEARDITLYAKWKYKAPGYNNIEHTFNKVGGGTVSSEAENGRPKLLIFANQYCGFTPDIITGIRDNIEWFQGVDVVCAVVTMTTVDEANAYIEAQKEENGCDGITFAYDNSNDWNETLTWSYIRRAISPVPQLYISPMLVYIDGDNKIQYAGGSGKPDQILDTLRKYCNYGAYRINYETYGGENDSENPAVYFEDSEDIVLKDPFMRGFQFEGWYRDPEYKKQVTVIPKGSTADYKLYAKWKVGGLSLDNLTQQYTSLDDTELTSEASGRPKILFFCIWHTTSMETLTNISGELMNNPGSILHGVDIYAIGTGSSMDKSRVQSVKKSSSYGGNCEEIIYAYDNEDGDNLEKAYEYKAAARYSGLFNCPIIAYVDEDNRLQYVTGIENVGAPAPTAAEIIANLKKYCDYEGEPSPELKEEKEKAKQQINAWNDSDFLAQYDTKDQAQIKEIADRLANDMKGRTEPSEIQELLSQAEKEVEALKTKEQKEEECQEKLTEYESKFEDYEETDMAELEAIKGEVEAALAEGDLEAAEAALAKMETALEEKAAGKKEEAKQELEDIQSDITADEELDEGQRAEIEAALSEAEAAVENAKDATAVKEALENAQQKIEAIKQKGRELKEEKEKADQQIGEWNGEDFLAQYGESEQAQIREIADKLAKDMEGRTEPSEIRELLSLAKAEVAALKTEEQKELEQALNTARNDAFTQLDGLEAKLGDYLAAEQEKIKNAIAEAKAKIEAAENEDAVREALAEAVRIFNEQPTAGTVTPEPATPNPGTPNPATPDPATPSPGTEDLTTPNPATPSPGTEDLTTPNPATPDPGTPDLTTPNPATPNPVTPDPGMPNPEKQELKEGDSVVNGNLMFVVLDPEEKTASVCGVETAKGKKFAVNIPATVEINGIECKVTEVGKKGFAKFAKITKVTLGRNITKVGKNAFDGCGAVKSLTVNGDVKTFEAKCFNGCKKLKTITFKGRKVPAFKSKAFKGTASKVKVKLARMSKKDKAKMKKLLKKAGMKKIS